MVASAVRDALLGARAGVAQLREVAAAALAVQDGALRDEAAALEREAARVLAELERRVRA